MDHELFSLDELVDAAIDKAQHDHDYSYGRVTREHRERAHVITALNERLEEQQRTIVELVAKIESLLHGTTERSTS
ncbi:MAG: hypothetical protein NVSMB52_20390 [Chloroflexota bacterium]